MELVVTNLLRLPVAEAFIIDSSEVPWTSTASGTRNANGDPATITWSLVPDGTTIRDGSGASLGGSNLISFLNGTLGGNSSQTDPTQQPWFPLLADSFDRWSQLGGVTYQYEPNDDGGVQSVGNGQLGVRGDIRIGGAPIDGPSGTLAFSFLPSSGSDIVLDTNDGSFFANAGGDHVRLRNTLAHELGHGFGLQHVISNTDNLLMAPLINTTFDGPQLDEVRGIQFHFGDRFEKSHAGLGNGSAALATDLGVIPTGSTINLGADANVSDQAIGANATDFVSISNLSDTDFFSFSTTGPAQLDALLTPRGGTFDQASEGHTPVLFNASARSDLTLTVLAADGSQVLAMANLAGLGEAESIVNLDLPSAGSYFAEVTGADDTIQLYELDLSVTAMVFLSADFNTDSAVDSNDLLLWKSALGSIAGADADGDGDTDGGDFLAWQQQFGRLPVPPALAAVPEPATAMLALLAVLLLDRNGRARAHGPTSRWNLWCADAMPSRMWDSGTPGPPA